MKTIGAILGSPDFNPLTSVGRKHSKETIEKIRLGNLGKRLSSESIEKMRLAGLGRNKGKHHSPETIEKMRQAQLGKYHSSETREKMRLAKLGKNHPGWKGDDAGRGAVHAYIRKHRPKPDLCESCHMKPVYDTAFLFHPQKYTRNPNDYRWLCRGCHERYDYMIGVRKHSGPNTEVSKQKLRLANERRRIDLGQICIRCKSKNIIRHSIRNNKQRFQCKDCKKGYTILISDLMEQLQTSDNQPALNAIQKFLKLEMEQPKPSEEKDEEDEFEDGEAD